VHTSNGRRYGLVLSPTDMAWSVVTIVPTSTKAQPAAGQAGT
jgi:mRNA interferase MazF